MKRRLNRLKLIVCDILLINIAYLLAIYIRFDNIQGQKALPYLNIYISNLIYIIPIKVLVFYYFKMYRTLWKYASIKELLNIVIASLVSNTFVLSFLYIKGIEIPRSLYILVILLDLVLIGGLRFSYRVFNVKRILNRFRKHNEKRIMIIGAGDAGVMVHRELGNHTQLESRVVAFIDDNPLKHGNVIHGVIVVGGRDKIIEIANKYKVNEIIIAMPSSSKKEISNIIEISKQTQCKLKIVPGMYELIDGKIDIKSIRNVKIEDILGREEIKTDLANIISYVSDKIVMVTGGGGSIGSELCRQISQYNPKRLIILDIYENSTYDIQNELKRNNPKLDLKVYIGSIRDRVRMEEIISSEMPNVIFHAAAHKHVPLMEDSPKEAIKNNVFGTLNISQLADKYEVSKFVMISTDKAVNPTNVMGASKRIGEMIIQSMNVHSKTEYVAVRFGNVLGSNGSVIPLFMKQIEEGGPVTVTHKDIIRYFMTIPEAVQLVIQAGAMAKGGEIFILDMGEPVKIMDLARDVIRFAGFEPDVDMPIKITGLRPGEKLFEELLLAEEGISNTEHKKIFVGQPIFTDYKLLVKSLDELDSIIKQGTDVETINYVRAIVPTYKDNGETNGQSLPIELSYSE